MTKNLALKFQDYLSKINDVYYWHLIEVLKWLELWLYKSITWNFLQHIAMYVIHRYKTTTRCVAQVKLRFQFKQLIAYFLKEFLNIFSIILCMCAELLQSCLTLCDPMDCGLPGSSVHEIAQARILEWVPCPPSGNLPLPRGWTHISSISSFSCCYCC